MTFRLALGLLAPLIVAAAPAPRLLPQPAALQAQGIGFSLSHGAMVVAPPDDAGAANAAQRLKELFAASGMKLAKGAQAPPTIRFARVAGMQAEAYTLKTDPGGATISASDDSGLFYGAVTLWQLATQTGTPGRVAGVSITDAPRFKWRGILLDSARHYQSPAYIRQMIDWLAANKLNTLHWHLVDDQSWRLEIKAYPKLTKVAAFRRPATAPNAPPLPQTGGFYTQAEVRALVAYAQARGVTIVPEIEMPGHATAAILAYPQLGLGTPPKASDMGHWGVFPWIYKPSDETFRFLETVLGETLNLFPSRYIHIGGDEPVFDRWKADLQVQAQMRGLGLKDEHQLHGWFMARLAGFLDARGRRAIGWDEVLEGGVPKSTTIMSWRGTEGAIKAARDGHDTVLSPSPDLYIDHVQGIGPNEPPGRGGVITLKSVQQFDPAPASLTPEQRGHILGVQANAWSEHIRTEARNAWMTWPRAAAIAEVGWSAKRDDYRGFVERLVPQLDRMRPLGLTAADSAFNVTALSDAGRDGVITRLTNQSDLPIRYTTDGSDPLGGKAYDAPLKLADGTRLRAVALLDGRAVPGALDTNISLAGALTRTSRELETCTKNAVLDLEDDYPAKGPRAHFVVDILKPCWIWRDAPVGQGGTIRLDVGQVPFNFEIGADKEKITFAKPRSPSGEFEIRTPDCDGPVIASFPLAPAARNPGVTSLTAPIVTARARADLCITYTARGVDPLWVLDKIAILPK